MARAVIYALNASSNSARLTLAIAKLLIAGDHRNSMEVIRSLYSRNRNSAVYAMAYAMELTVDGNYPVGKAVVEQKRIQNGHLSGKYGSFPVFLFTCRRKSTSAMIYSSIPVFLYASNVESRYEL